MVELLDAAGSGLGTPVRAAVEREDEVVPRHRHACHLLGPGDRASLRRDLTTELAGDPGQQVVELELEPGDADGLAMAAVERLLERAERWTESAR